MRTVLCVHQVFKEIQRISLSLSGMKHTVASYCFACGNGFQFGEVGLMALNRISFQQGFGEACQEELLLVVWHGQDLFVKVQDPCPVKVFVGVDVFFADGQDP